MSSTPLSSPLSKLLALDSKTMTLPSGESTAAKESPLPCNPPEVKLAQEHEGQIFLVSIGRGGDSILVLTGKT